jgi:hypothetical protein
LLYKLEIHGATEATRTFGRKLPTFSKELQVNAIKPLAVWLRTLSKPDENNLTTTHLAKKKATSYTNAIDQWISIVDAQKALEKARKEEQGTRDGETQDSLNWCDSQFRLWSDKKELDRLTKDRKRKRQRASSTNSNGSDEGNDSNSDNKAKGDETSVGTGIDEDNPTESSISTPSLEVRNKRRKPKEQRKRTYLKSSTV